MPNKYPVKIRHEDAKLTPLAVLAFTAFITATGHDAPKQINISASKN